MKLGVLGLGFMGRTHLLALENIPQCEVVAVASDNPVALAGDLSSVEGHFGVPGEKFDFSAARKYSDWRDAVSGADVDAFDICLPTNLHAPAAVAALEAGKHVLVEKPLALNGEEADRMLAAAGKAGRLLMTAQVLRFFPEYQPLIASQRSGGLGQARAAMFRRRCGAPAWGAWLTDPEKSGGGIFDLLIHDADMSLHLFGPPMAVSATGFENISDGIDIITAQLYYRDGLTAVIAGGWHHPGSYPFSMEYTVSFDGGTLEYSSAGKPPMLYGSDGTAKPLDTPGKDGYQAEIEYFLECASGNKRPELCTPEESAASVKLMRLLEDARSRKGEIIECKL